MDSRHDPLSPVDLASRPEEQPDVIGPLVPGPDEDKVLLLGNPWDDAKVLTDSAIFRAIGLRAV